METSNQDGIHLAMPDNVHVILGMPVPVGADHVRMHSTYTAGCMESCFKRECTWLSCPRTAFIMLSLGEIAVIYLGVAVLAAAVFVFCSFWVYHYVDLEHEFDDSIEFDMQ